MLVLSRKSQEQIQIGDNITITVLRIQGNSIRLGIDAPDKIRVIRTELIDKREREETQTARQSAAQSSRRARARKRRCDAESDTPAMTAKGQAQRPQRPSYQPPLESRRLPATGPTSTVRRSPRLGPATIGRMGMRG